MLKHFRFTTFTLDRKSLSKLPYMTITNRQFIFVPMHFILPKESYHPRIKINVMSLSYLRTSEEVVVRK
jgi:hypothetical protein